MSSKVVEMTRIRKKHRMRVTKKQYQSLLVVEEEDEREMRAFVTCLELGGTDTT